MAGYVRQSSADIIATAVVRANPLNVEYNALRDAFNASTGHKHDGTAAEGAYVPLIADSDALNKVVIDTSNNRVGVFVEVSSAAVEQIRIQDGAVVPVTNNDIDLGTSSLQFKDLFIDGTATVDALQVDANAVVTGNLTVNGNATLGNAASDTVTITADVASPLLPSADDTYDLGSVGSEWRNLYIDGTANIDALVADTADINGGTVDGAVIGGASAAAGTFTSLTATGTSTLTTVDINGGNIDGTIIGAGSAAAITGTTITGTSLVGPVTGDVTGNADTATALETARTIGGVSFNGTANINLPGVNTSGNQDTSGNAATATALETARTIGGVSFNGTSNINLAGVNTAGNQDTSGNAASATVLETARTIAGNSFNGSANITIAATDLSDTDQSLATSDNVQFASVTGNLTGNVTSTGSNSFGSITVSGTATLNGNTIIGNANSDTVTVTADVASNLIPSADSTYSLGDSSNYWSHGYIDAVTTTGNVIVGGDLTVNGTTTTVNSNNMTVDDQLIELGNGRSGSASGDAGIVIERGDDANAFIGFDESANKFTVGTGTFTGASTGDLTITTGTLVANIEGNVTGNITGNVSGDVTGNADTATALETARTIGGVSFDGTSNINLPGVNTAGNQNTSGNAATATALETARTIAGQSFNGTANITIAPTDLTGVNATATELNIMDGDTSATSTTLADADRVVVNDAGTMKQVALTDFETYMETSLDTLSNVTTVGALNSGSITSGFGSIDVGSSSITTTGTINFGSLADGSITATGFVDEDNMSSNSATLIPTQQSVKAYVDTVAGASNNVTGLTATGTELNTVADFSAVSVDTSTAIASNDALLVFDNGNEIGYRDVDLLDTYFSGTTKTLTNKTLTSPVVTGMHLNDSGFTVEGSGADGNETTVAFTNPTADRTITFPNATGNVAVFATAPTAAISDGSAGQFLKTDGSGNLAFAAAGADLYAANESSPAAQPSATGANAIAIGDSATATSDDDVAIGVNANATASGSSPSLALGRDANATSGGIAIGNFTDATGTYGTAIGTSADATAINASALGNDAKGAGSDAVALGKSRASGSYSLAAAIANNTSSYGATGANSVAIGKSAKATGTESISIGRENIASGERSFAAGGYNATASGTDTVAIGYQAQATAAYAAAIGFSNEADGIGSLALGYNSTASSQNSVVIGNGVQSTAANQVSIGGTTDTVRISETYTLPTSDGSANQVLTTNGSGVVAFADAGGGADLYAANESSPPAQPSATGVNAVAIGEGSVASGEDSFAVGNLATASGDYSNAFGVTATATGFTSVAIGKARATGAGGFAACTGTHTSIGATSNSVAIGEGAHASAAKAVSLGNSFSNSVDSFAAAIANNTSSYGATGANSIAMGATAKATSQDCVAIGDVATATGTRSTVLGGYQGTASAEGAVVLGGYYNTSSGVISTTIGGQENIASGQASVAWGVEAKADIYGKKAYASGKFAALGDAQGGQFILRADTTDATATVLTTNNSTAAATNQIVAASDTCIMFSGTLVAMQNGAQDQGGWEIKGLLKNDGGTTTLVSSNIQTFDDGNGWVVALTADNTNNALAITCTGEASHNIRWVANIQTSEVTYA